MSLALALLAGKGFDGWMAWLRPGRSLGAVHLCGVVLGSGNSVSDRAGDFEYLEPELVGGGAGLPARF